MIELIMVVAIMALLVAIIFISLTVVRAKAGDSVIKNDVDQLRKYAETMYTENSLRGYCLSPGSESCFELNNPRLAELTADIQKRSKTPGKTYALSNAERFCIHVNMSDNSYYCVDSASKQVAGDGSPFGKCYEDPMDSANFLKCK